MATTVETRPNHYETLGLTPAASEEEIGEAFAREIILSRMRAFGGTAQLSIAYETLRDPARRRAYDDSIGVRRELPPLNLPRAVSFRSSAHFISGPPIEPRAEQPPPPVEEAGPKVPPPPPEPELPPEPKIAPFLAASLRNPEAPAVAPPTPRPEPDLPQYLRYRPPPTESAEAEPEEAGFNWKQPALIVGALVGTVALVGAWAGVQAGNDVEASQPAVTVEVPRAQAPVAEPATVSEPTASPRRIAAYTAKQRPRAASRPVEQTEQVAVHRQATSGPFEEIAQAGAVEAAPALTEDEPAEAASASMPISHAAIAQTIRKIGYPCGQVTATSQILGNVFKVTCSSGDTYRAAPNHGRYHFKRL